MSKKLVFYNILKYIFFFLMLTVLQFGEVNGFHPLAFGMLFALVWCNQKIYVVAPMYVASALLVELNFQNFLCAICTIFVFVLFFALHYKLKKPLNKLFIGLYAFLSQSLFIYFNSSNFDLFLNALCALVIGMVCMYAYLFFMQSLLLRGLRRKYATDEILCAGVLFFSLGVGISCLPNCYVAKGILVFLVLLLCFVLSSGAGISFSVLLGVGSMFATQDYQFLLILVLMALVSNLSKTSLTIFYILSVILIDFFTNFYFFNSFYVFDFLPTFVACFLFFILRKFLKKLRYFVIDESEDFSARFFINKSKAKLANKLLDTSNLFLTMQHTFVSMTKDNLTPNQAVLFVADEARKQVCKTCPKFENCQRQNPQIFVDLQTLSALSLSRGTLGFFDVPSNMNAHCIKSKVFIQKIVEISKGYKNFCATKNGLDAGRLALADQLFGVSQILKSLSDFSSTKIVFSPEKEQKLLEELLLNQILCSEVLINFSKEKLCDVTLIVKTSNLNPPKISQIASKILKQQMEVKQIENSSKSGFSVVTLKPKIFFDVVFGCCGAVKSGSGLSGDNHSAIRICEDKIMMALCDGMGSGKKANDISTLALDLIEKFYKAGFGTDLILENVNTLLSMRDDENFGALDICVFDLKLCACDILKLGAPVSFLKQKSETKIVEASALPLGILSDVKPSSKSFALQDGDMIILLTDGAVDVAQNLEWLKNEINNFGSKNPQEVADYILKICMKKCQNMPPDDMTVLVGKIWRKI